MTRLWTHIIAAGFFLLLMSPYRAFAGCNGFTSSVTQNTALNWGTWAVPGSPLTTAIVTAAGATTGSSGAKIYGAVAPADFTVLKTGGVGSCSTVTFSIATPIACGTGCSVTSFTGSWAGGAEQAFPITSATLPSAVANHLKIGATATYGPTVPVASNSPGYTISIVVSGGTADNHAETGTIAFDTPLSFGAVTGINFGYAKAATAGDYVMSTTGTVTPSGGGVLEPGGATAVGSVTIIGSTTQGITISVGNFVTVSGVTPSVPTGKYGGGADDASFPMNVGAPGAGTVLKLGVKVHADGSQTDGTTATPTFDVTVVYQ